MEQTAREKRLAMVKQLIAVLICFFGIRLILASFLVDGQSLAPTYQSGDKILVEKISHRFGGVETGDYIIVRPAHLKGQVALKKVIGVPDDVFEIHDNQIWVNGQPVEFGKTEEEDRPEAEIIPKGKFYTSMGQDPNAPGQGLLEFTNQEDIVGVALFRFWPFSR